MSGQGDPNAEKNSLSGLWLVAAIFGVGLVLWLTLKTQIMTFFLALRRFEVAVISFFVDTPAIRELEMAVERLTIYDLNQSTAISLSNYVGQYLQIPVTLLLIVMIILVMRSHVVMRYSKTYDMNKLMDQEKDLWPQISPVADVPLIDLDLNDGPWRVALNPMQFGKQYKLLTFEKILDTKSIWKAEGIIQATVDKERAKRVFSSQLGPHWEGVDRLPPHTKALYACFLARIEHDVDAAADYLKKLSISAAAGDINYEDTESLLEKYGSSKAAERVGQRHAYITTVMATMIELSRGDGVMASADFIWLKPIDRRLWYILNTVGRQVAVSEIAGAFAHWKAEKELLRPLNVPMVEEAVTAYEKAVSMMLYTPEEGEEIPWQGQGETK